jgi:hypothetical protein
MKILSLTLATLALLPAIGSALPDSMGTGTEVQTPPSAARDWILKTADNICGLRDANQLTSPAVIDFETCLAATSEMKKVQQQGIDPKSAEGIQLRSAAITRVTKACEAVRTSAGYCSVWKEIRHRDGRAITDISSQVIAQF